MMTEQKIETVHIRWPTDHRTLCGAIGSSISWRHARTQPAHVASLPMCETCLRLLLPQKPPTAMEWE